MRWVLGAVWLVMLAGFLYQRIGSARDRRRFPPPGRYVDLGKRRLHLQCAGTGPTVILDAGIAASSLSWSRVHPRVAEFAAACTYDRAGLAWSDPAPRRLSASRLAADLYELTSAAALPPPFVLVGHSFGAFVVQAFADRHPHLVAGLVLVDPVYPSEWLPISRDQRWRLSGGIFMSRVGAILALVGVVRACLTLLARGATAVPRRVSRMFGSETARVLDRLVGEVRKLPAEVWPVVQAHWSQPTAVLSMARHLAGLRASAEEIRRCAPLPPDLPLVVITAASQTADGRAAHARLASCSRAGRHAIAVTGGHWIHLDDPDLVVDAIREVVEQVRRPRTGR
jgi:pimeloyl-ACP methyl ester carboxylesterase